MLTRCFARGWPAAFACVLALSACADSRSIGVGPRSSPDPSLHQPIQVPRFGRFEQAVELPASGALGQQQALARWHSPAGQTIETTGFQTGDGIHFRFSPAELGTYSFELIEMGGHRPRVVRHGTFES